MFAHRKNTSKPLQIHQNWSTGSLNKVPSIEFRARNTCPNHETKKGPLLAILSRPRYETVFYRGFLGTQSAPTSLYSIEKMGSTTPAPALYRFFDLMIQSFTRKISSRPASPRCFCHCLCKAPNVAPCNSRAKAGCYIGT